MTGERQQSSPAVGTAVAAGASSAGSVRTGASCDEAARAVLEDLRAVESPDLVLAFVDSRWAEHYEAIVALLWEGLGAVHLVGCSGQAVIGPAREAEDEPSVAAMALRLPGAVFTPMSLLPQTASPRDLDALDRDGVSTLVIFADPFSVQAERLLDVIEQRHPGLTLLGGMASTHDGSDTTAVFLDGQVHGGGAVILAIGGVEVRTLVAQGAEPIGQPWTITDCEQNLVRTIGNRPAIDVLRETLGGLDEATRERAQRNLLVGLAIDEYRDRLGRGDYLIRNMLGFDPESGAISINANARVGQTLHFQFRDAEAADEDLREQLATLLPELDGHEVLGALLCTCNGRGRALFGGPDHDARAIADTLGPVPTAGLFCNGEIGLVGGKPFLHGFTASVGLFLSGGAEAAT
jgi:small ligand-binding sensory domain FIST